MYQFRGELVTRKKIKLEKGKVATPYSKYGQGCVKVTKCNKNIIDLAKCQIKTSNGVTSTYNKENNSITFNGTCTGNNTLFNIYIDNINATKNATTLTAKWISGTVSGYAVARCYDEDWKQNVQVNLAQLNASNKISGKTYNDVADVFSHFDFRFEKGTVLNNFTIQLMLTDVVDNDYIEYQGQSYIMPIQQEMLADDYIDGVEYHTWKKIILTGNEPVYIDNVYHGITQFTIPLPVGGLSIKDDTVRILSNYFKGVGWNNSWTIDNSVTIRYLNDFRIMTSQYATVEDFKAWLKSKYDEGNPVIVYYKLAIPIDLELTEEQKAVAKELNNARTYKNVTNITTDSKAILSLDYAKDLETLLTSKESEV